MNSEGVETIARQIHRVIAGTAAPFASDPEWTAYVTQVGLVMRCQDRQLVAAALQAIGLATLSAMNSHIRASTAGELAAPLGRPQ